MEISISVLYYFNLELHFFNSPLQLQMQFISGIIFNNLHLTKITSVNHKFINLWLSRHSTDGENPVLGKRERWGAYCLKEKEITNQLNHFIWFQRSAPLLGGNLTPSLVILDLGPRAVNTPWTKIKGEKYSNPWLYHWKLLRIKSCILLI